MVYQLGKVNPVFVFPSECTHRVSRRDYVRACSAFNQNSQRHIGPLWQCWCIGFISIIKGIITVYLSPYNVP